MYEKQERIMNVQNYNLDELSFEDIKCLIHTGQAHSDSPGRGHKKVTSYTERVRTKIGDIEISEWRQLAKSMIDKAGETQLYNDLKIYIRSTGGFYKDEQTILEYHASRIFDNEEWVDFIPFNQEYRPEILKGVRFVKVLNKCCNKPGMITEAAYERRVYENKCTCPHCGRLSEMEVEKCKK